MWAGVPGGGTGDIASQDILNRYLQAEQTQGGALRGASMDVDIDASIPKLKEHGRLHALRQISKVGTVTYHAITFQGDNTVKHQIIARYLDAEREAQTNQSLKITLANYKFKFKGGRTTATGAPVYVFEVIPRHRRVGLFKGDLWLDARTYLPVYEKGRLVKNPSIFFKKVEFERAYAVETGVPVPVHTASVIKTRLVGKVELNVSYSNFELNTADADAETSAASEDADVVRSSSAAQVGSGPYAPRE
jgi:hypothetical protein